MKFERTSVYNFDNALHGMRNAMNSWDKSDSGYGCHVGICCKCDCASMCHPMSFEDDYNYNIAKNFNYYIIGENDLKLAQRLIKAGSDHSKFMRQIFVSVDITAPLYFFKEFDTYKVDTVANSTSTMHRLATTPITPDCFEFDSVIESYANTDGSETGMTVKEAICNLLENYRKEYLRTKDKRVWRALIQLLPASWLQTRTITMSYQNIRAMYFARKNHKLTEWSVDFVDWAKELPYSKEILLI